MEDSISYKSFLNSKYLSTKHTTYFEVYDEVFKKYINKDVTFVEIGVLSGGSLFMWRKFFGPKARIIGIDLNPEAKKWEKEGFEIYIGSQSDENFWNEFIKKVGPIDIVLDDGGHTYDQQIITVEMLVENINDGGVLVVEDTHSSYMKGFGNQKYSFINYTKKIIDKINYRFSGFNNKSEKRIWSISFYESIVVFRINNSSESKPISNNGISDSAKDFRGEDLKKKKIYHMLIFFKFFTRIAVFQKLYNYFLSESLNEFNSKKYFD